MSRLRPTPLLPEPSRLRDTVAWGRLLLAALLLTALTSVAWHATRDGSPQQLSATRLTGPRGPGCVHLAVLADTSGSMAPYANAVSRAVTELLAWAPANLTDRDKITVIGFSGTAHTAVPTQAITSGHGSINLGTPSDGTQLQPALAELSKQPTTHCRTNLLVMSDGLIQDTDPTALLKQAEAAHADTVQLLLPSRHLHAPRAWQHLLPYARCSSYDGSSLDQTALTLARRLADDTGQRLTAVRGG